MKGLRCEVRELFLLFQNIIITLLIVMESADAVKAAHIHFDSFKQALSHAFNASFALIFPSDQDWSHRNNLAEQPRGAVVCYGLVGYTTLKL